MTRPSLLACSLLLAAGTSQVLPMVGRPDGLPDDLAAQAEGTPAVVYVLATDSRNAPVTDLTSADFTVKEDGKLREVISAEIATAPMRIAILVDDNGTGIFRYGLGQFAQRMRGRAELSLRVVTGQVRTLTDYTTDVQAWINALAQLGVRPSTNDGGQLLEGVSEAAKELKKRETARPVILALTVGGEEHSPIPGRVVLDQLYESRAALHVVYAGNPAVRSQVAVARPADLLEANLNLDQVLGDGPKQSGGRRRDVIATQALLTELQAIAGELTSQYAIKYVRPPDRNAPQKIQVSVQRKGVSLLAPARAPAR